MIETKIKKVNANLNDLLEAINDITTTVNTAISTSKVDMGATFKIFDVQLKYCSETKEVIYWVEYTIERNEK